MNKKYTCPYIFSRRYEMDNGLAEYFALGLTIFVCKVANWCFWAYHTIAAYIYLAKIKWHVFKMRLKRRKRSV